MGEVLGCENEVSIFELWERYNISSGEGKWRDEVGGRRVCA